MDRVGTVVKIAQGLLVVRSDTETYPSVGSKVIDDQLVPVGSVVDIIGPRNRPFIVVSPEESGGLVSYLNSRLYTR